MTPEDLPGVVDLAMRAPWAIDDDESRARQRGRVTHQLKTDPQGAWVATEGAAIVGAALALVREDLWGLSLLLVDQAHHGAGIGRGLLARVLECSAGLGHGLIASSEHPAAMRLYARAGFALRPCVGLAGRVGRSPERPAGVELDVAYGPWMDALAREIRGGGYGSDPGAWRAAGMRLSAVEQRGWCVTSGPRLGCLMARDEEAARVLLAAHLAAVGPDEEVVVNFVTADQDWAIETALRAGLALETDGPMFVRGPVDSPLPWLPSGAYL